MKNKSEIFGTVEELLEIEFFVVDMCCSFHFNSVLWSTGGSTTSHLGPAYNEREGS